jgi:hypothetical protein
MLDENLRTYYRTYRLNRIHRDTLEIRHRVEADVMACS